MFCRLVLFISLAFWGCSLALRGVLLAPQNCASSWLLPSSKREDLRFCRADACPAYSSASIPAGFAQRTLPGPARTRTRRDSQIFRKLTSSCGFQMEDPLPLEHPSCGSGCSWAALCPQGPSIYPNTKYLHIITIPNAASSSTSSSGAWDPQGVSGLDFELEVHGSHHHFRSRTFWHVPHREASICPELRMT